MYVCMEGMHSAYIFLGKEIAFSSEKHTLKNLKRTKTFGHFSSK